MDQRICVLMTVIALLSACCLSAASAQSQMQDSERPLKAGFAWANIMPDEIPSDRVVHNTLKTRVAVFDDGNTRIAFVGVDSLWVGSPSLIKRVRSEAQRLYGIPETNLMIAGTHTHSGIPLNEPTYDYSDATGIVKQLTSGNSDGGRVYRDKVADRIISALKQAAENMEEVDISIGSGHEDKVVSNRRYRMKNGRVFTHPGKGNPDIVDYAGPIDPEVGVVAVWSRKDGRLLGSIVNFACHCTTQSNVASISGDYPYFTEKTIQGGTGSKDAVVLFLNGASGDVGHVDNLSLNEAEFGKKYAEKVGTCIGAEALKVMVSAEKGKHYPLAAASRTLKIDRRKTSETRYKQALALVEEALANNKTDSTDYTFAVRRVLNKFVTEKYPVADVEVQALQIGETVFLSNPSELFCELGLKVKRGSKFPRTYVVGLANGSVGYVPTLEAFQPDGGGYETVLGVGSLDVNAGNIIADACIELADSLKPGTAPRTPTIKPGEEGFAVRVPWSYGVLGPDPD